MSGHTVCHVLIAVSTIPQVYPYHTWVYTTHAHTDVRRALFTNVAGDRACVGGVETRATAPAVFSPLERGLYVRFALAFLVVFFFFFFWSYSVISFV